MFTIPLENGQAAVKRKQALAQNANEPQRGAREEESEGHRKSIDIN